MRKLVLAIALCFAGTAAAADAAWVERSNALSKTLLDAQAQFGPEGLSFFGIPGYDDRVADFGPDSPARFRAAMEKGKAELQKLLAAEKDPNVRQDLEIMIDTAERNIATSAVNEKWTLPFGDVPRLVYFGMQPLLKEDVSPERRNAAKLRLERYVGLAPGSKSAFAEMKARYAEALAANPKLLAPVKNQVDQAIAGAPTFAAGIRKLAGDLKVEGMGPGLDALDKETAAFVEWAKTTVLPAARTDFVLPRELYADNLDQIGIDVDPLLLIERAQLEFMETRNAMQQLAPQVAKMHGIAATDYRDVIRALKRKPIAKDRIEAHYRDVNRKLEAKIVEHGVVDLPKREMAMRLASAAETAAQPAPHMDPPQMVGNTGQQGTFVLPTENPAAAGEAYDDFNFDAVSWTLSAHEGRPGHELQFSAMVERGVSLARSLFAFNSVNVEGWALYAEAEMVPYEPIDGQLMALQFRLLRAARAMLDPMLNLGLISRERAGEVLRNDVVLSNPMAQQELDRYTFNAPGQAGAYFYGYARLMELRAETELALGAKFDRLAFNNFILGQGLLPPALLAKAVREEFVPKYR